MFNSSTRRQRKQPMASFVKFVGIFILICVWMTTMASPTYARKHSHPVSRQTCLAETNAARSHNGKVAAYGNNAQLVQAAINHNNAMVAGNCFSHKCRGELSLGKRVTRAGYEWSRVAENLAAGSNNCQGSVKQWLNSPGHRANLLGNYKHIGCAAIDCNCQYGTYWTCVYAKPL